MRRLSILSCIMLSVGAGFGQTEITISLRVPSEVISRIEVAFTSSYSFQPTVPNPDFNEALPEDPTLNPRTIANPETKRQFVRRMIARYVMEVTRAYEIRTAGENAAKTAREKAESEVVVQ